MKAEHVHHCRRPLAGMPALLVGCLCFLGMGPTAIASDAGTRSANPPGFRHELENTRFAGTWFYEWDEEPVEGVFIFDDGKFISQNCVEWGYEPAPYYVRHAADGVHFYARLPNPEHGPMEFRGVFDGNTLRADVHWKKERWYWTLEQRYRFTGKPIDAEQ